MHKVPFLLLFLSLTTMAAEPTTKQKRKPAAIDKVEIVICGQSTDKDASRAATRALRELQSKQKSAEETGKKWSPPVKAVYNPLLLPGEGDGVLVADSVSKPFFSFSSKGDEINVLSCATVEGQPVVAGP